MTELFTIGRDAEVRYAGQDNMPVVNLSLAYNYGQKDQSTGRRPTQWIDATLWGKRAETLAPYLTRSAKVVATLEEVHTENFQKGDGSTGNKMVGKVIAITLAGSPQNAAPQASPPPAPRPAPRPAAPKASSGFDDMDDDIPFASPCVEHDPIHGHRKAMRARAAR
ncbi:MAG TPA: single-stranded DNA-binding protein [Roseateles sp.]